MLFPQFMHLWHVPLRTVIVPQTSHAGASPTLSIATDNVEAMVMTDSTTVTDGTPALPGFETAGLASRNRSSPDMRPHGES